MLLSNQIFQVEWRVLRALNGWQLKAYILLSNSPKPLTCCEVAEAFAADRKTVWLALIGLCEKAYIRREGDTYRVVKIPPLCGKMPTACGEMPKENFPQTPIIEKTLCESAQNARTHSHELDFFLSQLTDNPELKGLAEEFLRGEIKRGENLEARGIADLKRHFTNWLPKYRAVKEIEERRQQRSSTQNEAKLAREADADALQRRLDEQRRAAESEEALAEKARVCAKYGKPRKASAPNVCTQK